MKVLCVCQAGHSRSVALVRELHSRGISAVACGWQTAGPWLDVMCREADTIFVMETYFEKYIPADQKHKIGTIDVGRDKWANPFNPELAALVKKLYSAWADKSDACTRTVEWTPKA